MNGKPVAMLRSQLSPLANANRWDGKPFCWSVTVYGHSLAALPDEVTSQVMWLKEHVALVNGLRNQDMHLRSWKRMAAEPFRTRLTR